MKLLCSILIIIVSEYAICQQHQDTIFIKEILEVNREMEQEFNEGQYSKIGQYYADNAVMVGNKVEVIGKNNLINYWGQFDNAHEWMLENIQLTILAPDVALQRGFSNISFYKDDKLQVSRSIFSLVWIKTETGWKILLDHFSPR